MSTTTRRRSGVSRSRWAAVGAAVAVTLGAGGLIAVNAAPGDTGDVLVAIQPARLLDTRPGGIAAGGMIELDVLGRGGVPGSGVSAVVLNVTMIRPDSNGFVTIYPCGTRPNASSMNAPNGGGVVANEVIAKLSASGTVCLYSSTPTNLAADITGYFIPAPLGGPAGPTGATGATGATGPPGTGGGGGDVVVVSEFTTLAPLTFVSGDLFCPSGYTPIGTGHASTLLTTIILVPDGASYFLFNDSSTLDLTVAAQVSCLSGVTQNGSQKALFSAAQNWDEMLESLSQHASEFGGE
jgi:hypothetical protein